MKSLIQLARRHARATVTVSALGITLLATVVSGRETPTEETVVPSVRAAAEAATRPTAVATEPLAAIDLDRLKRSRVEGPIADLFGAEPVEPAGPGPIGASGIPRAPVPPVEQPLPFTYLGRMVEEGKVSVFLAQGNDSYSVRQGETVQQYRVDKITESDVRFVHVPTKAQKVLAVPPLN